MPETQLLEVRNRSEVQGHGHPWLNSTVCLRPARSAWGSASSKGKGEKGWNVCLITFTFGLDFTFRCSVELDFFFLAKAACAFLHWNHEAPHVKVPPPRCSSDWLLIATHPPSFSRALLPSGQNQWRMPKLSKTWLHWFSRKREDFTMQPSPVQCPIGIGPSRLILTQDTWLLLWR